MIIFTKQILVKENYIFANKIYFAVHNFVFSTITAYFIGYRNSTRMFTRTFFSRGEIEDTLFLTATDMDEELLNKTAISRIYKYIYIKKVFSLVLHSLYRDVVMYGGDILLWPFL